MLSKSATCEAVGQFRALVMADEALADCLSRAETAERFADLVVRSASARGLSLAANDVHAAVRPDPLGLAGWSDAPADGAIWPPRPWLPIHVFALNDQHYVDWAHFGPEPLTDPFFEDSIRRALSRPFNRMFRYRMTLRDFLERADCEQSLSPSGFIFHLSRCGSTLAAQMFAGLPRNVVISEAAPIDFVVQHGRQCPEMPTHRHRELLIAMVAAFGRRRAGSERDYVIKLDSWHTLALPLFARAFPSVPWVFLYRDPVEVLVSQLRRRGVQTVPEIVPASLYGIDGVDGMASEEYCARVLGKISAAIIDGYRGGGGGGLLVNYRELPEAMWTRILPHFGMSCGEGERDIMQRAARHDAKAPNCEFSNDSAAKQREATETIRRFSNRHLDEVYRQLEALRHGGAPSVNPHLRK
jgi:hypothetical protein